VTAALLVALAVVAHAGPPAPAPGVPRGRQSGAPAAAGATALAPRGVVEGIAAALARDDVAGAKAAADPAIAAYPADPVLHNLAGVIEVRRGASSVAEAHFETAIRLQPRSPAPYINLGRLLQERAATDPAARPAARSVYARLLAVDPQHPEALFQTALLDALDGRFGPARDAIGLLPDPLRERPQVLAVRAVALAGSGDVEGARRTVAALGVHPRLAREDLEIVLPALTRLPDGPTEQALLELAAGHGWATPAALRRLAAIESAHGRYAEARAWLEKAAAAAGPDATILIELARAAFKAGDPKGSLGYLAHARELEPTQAAVHFLFGIVCVELELGAEAHQSLARAVALDPGNADINYAMGAVSLHRHDPSEALPYFEAYLRLRPGDPRGRFALGAARYYSQRLDEARADLTAAAADPRTAAGAHYYLARIARQQQDLDAARREIDAALRGNPGHADAWAELGLIETRRRDYAGAEAALHKALAIDPDNYDATMHLAALYGRTRDPRRAAQEARLQTLLARREVRAQEFLRLVQAVP